MVRWKEPCQDEYSAGWQPRQRAEVVKPPSVTGAGTAAASAGSPPGWWSQTPPAASSRQAAATARAPRDPPGTSTATAATSARATSSASTRVSIAPDVPGQPTRDLEALREQLLLREVAAREPGVGGDEVDVQRGARLLEQVAHQQLDREPAPGELPHRASRGPQLLRLDAGLVPVADAQGHEARLLDVDERARVAVRARIVGEDLDHVARRGSDVVVGGAREGRLRELAREEVVEVHVGSGERGAAQVHPADAPEAPEVHELVVGPVGAVDEQVAGAPQLRRLEVAHDEPRADALDGLVAAVGVAPPDQLHADRHLQRAARRDGGHLLHDRVEPVLERARVDLLGPELRVGGRRPVGACGEGRGEDEPDARGEDEPDARQGAAGAGDRARAHGSLDAPAPGLSSRTTPHSAPRLR